MPLKNEDDGFKAFGMKEISFFLLPYHRHQDELIVDFFHYHPSAKEARGILILGEDEADQDNLYTCAGMLSGKDTFNFVLQTCELFWLITVNSGKIPVFISMDIHCSRPILAPDTLECLVTGKQVIGSGFRLVATVSGQSGQGRVLVHANLLFSSASKPCISMMVAAHKDEIRQRNKNRENGG